MEQIQLTTREAVIWVMAINAIVGFVLGLIPLLFGYFNKNTRTGLAAITITTIGGAILGVFVSIPATILFTWLIVRSAKAKRSRPPASGEGS